MPDDRGVKAAASIRDLVLSPVAESTNEGARLGAWHGAPLVAGTIGVLVNCHSSSSWFVPKVERAC